MESPRSFVSMDSSSTSSEDSTSADSPSAQAITSMSENENPPAVDDRPANDNDDSDSDMSMSADSDDDEELEEKADATKTLPTQAIVQGTSISCDTPPQSTNAPAQAPNKRKFSESEDTQISFDRGDAYSHDARKRLKPDTVLQQHWTPDGTLHQDRSLLPAEVWHHVFTYCSPRVLGRLLQVNKAFNAYIDPSSSSPSYQPLSISATQILPPGMIWRASRNLYNLPSMPNPLLGHSELDMWKLGCGVTCQFCGKKKSSGTANAVPTDQWHPGPGENGVTPIWSFQIRSCGPCLQKETVKEIDLLLSSSVPSPLLVALPFIFLTNEHHVLPPSTLQTGQQPQSIQVAKHFSKAQIETIKRKFEEVKSLGSATAEEWLKGLDGQGQEKKNDAARWERWEAQGGVKRMCNLEAIEAATRLLRSARTTSITTNGTQLALQTSNTLPRPLHLPNNPMVSIPTTTNGVAANNSVPRFGSPVQNGFASYTPRQSQLSRPERTKEEVAELKLARKTEIERRCMLLNPPITAAVLAHMPSFQAAIQIIQPVTDSAWEVLEPRLLSQREEAEQREKDRLAQSRVVQEQERRLQDTQARSDSKDPADREWDDLQAPLRARISGYADEIIRDGWNGGDKVFYDTAPRFAADVLVYVRKRFYAEIAKDEAAIRATGREPDVDPPNGPYTRKLILENMKWVFDTKIKPITEQYRKELFLCNACDYGSKYYGFEGVIQHFAAKHTNALSSGSVVVHWKSEWPEYPPFNPDPSSMAAKPYYPAVQNPAIPYSSAPPPLPHAYSYGGYQSTTVLAPISTPQASHYQDAQGSYYSSAQYGSQYSVPQNGSYAPPMGYQESSPVYHNPQFPNPAHSTAPGYHDGSQGYPQTYPGQYPSANQDLYTSPHNASLYPAVATEAPVQQNSYVPPISEYETSYSQSTSYPSTEYAQVPKDIQPPQKTQEYVTQLQALAKNARSLWNSIGSVKEVPGSLKVYTLIYHILQRFQSTFQDVPSIAMMVDGLSNNKDMRPVRNVNGLLCKACRLGMAGSISGPQKKHYSFPQLVNHFHSAHAQDYSPEAHGHTPDWTIDMVDLPDISKLTSVTTAPGMDEQKLKLFTEAIPEIVASPKIQESASQTGLDDRYEDMADPSYLELAPSRDSHDKHYVSSDRGGQPIEPNGAQLDVGEYDPHNPRNISFDQQPVYRAPRGHRLSGEVLPLNEEDRQPRFRRYEEEPRRVMYQDRAEPQYVEQRPSSAYGLPQAGYERVTVREPSSTYMERPRYREPAEFQYRVRREPQELRYADQDMAPSTRDRRPANGHSSLPGRDEGMLAPQEAPREANNHQLGNTAATQHSHIIDVVAQISQHAQQARNQVPAKQEAAETGSEDGEVRTDNEAHPVLSHPSPTLGAAAAADRFLNEFQSSNLHNEPAPRSTQETGLYVQERQRPAWENDRDIRAQPEVRRREREYDGVEHFTSGSRRFAEPSAGDGYIIQERAPAPRPSRTYTYEDQYINTNSEQPLRDRSPELVDRRFKLNNVVYQDERQGSSTGMHRTPSRYARYESVRLENDRARSRSPVYVKMAPPTDQYRERSAGAPQHRPEPVYQPRSPPPAGSEINYERPPRQEYYRVYADEPRARAPQYAEPAYEYVRAYDAQGEYMIRRPVRREPAPVYYEDDAYARQPVYETRAPVPRAESQYEEYDPRHPAPGADAGPPRQRYQ